MDVFDKTKQHVFCEGLLQYVNGLKPLGFDFSPDTDRSFLPIGFGRKFIDWRGGILKELHQYYQGSCFSDYLEGFVGKTFSNYAWLDWIAAKIEPEDSREAWLDRFSTALLTHSLSPSGLTEDKVFAGNGLFLAASPDLLRDILRLNLFHEPLQGWTEEDLLYLMAAAEDHPEIVLEFGEDIMAYPADVWTLDLYLRFLVWMLDQGEGGQKLDDPEVFFRSVKPFFTDLFREEHLPTEKTTWGKLSADSWQLLYFLRGMVNHYAAYLRESGELDFSKVKEFIDLQKLVEAYMPFFLQNGGEDGSLLAVEMEEAFLLWEEAAVRSRLQQQLLSWPEVLLREKDDAEPNQAEMLRYRWKDVLATAEFATSVLHLHLDLFWEDIQGIFVSDHILPFLELIPCVYPHTHSYYGCITMLYRMVQFCRGAKRKEDVVSVLLKCLDDNPVSQLCPDADSREMDMLRKAEDELYRQLRERRENNA